MVYGGRGYTQLTWWYNCAGSSAVAGYGLRTLINRDETLKPDIAYRVMTYCMRTGSGFTNGHDKAVLITGIVRKFAVMLKAASSPVWSSSRRG